MPETTLTNLEYALLGLLSMAPMSGYDVQRIFASTPLAHFSSSPGAIYPALKRLEGKGLLRASIDARTELRPRRLFTVSEEGAGALGAWLRQPVTREELIRNGDAPILRFSLAEGKLSREDLIAYLDGYGKVLRDYVAELSRCRRQMVPSTLHQQLSLDHGIRSFASQAEWAATAIAVLRASA